MDRRGKEREKLKMNIFAGHHAGIQVDGAVAEYGG